MNPAAPPQNRLTGINVGETWTRLVQAGPVQANEVVVFLHGNPGSAEDWIDLVTEIGGLRRTVAFDLPDFGQSVAPPDFTHTVAEYADFLDQAFEVLGIERVHLVMHDFGGPIGLAWAIRNLGRVAGVTLIDTGILTGYRWHRIARVWQTPGLGEIAQAVTARALFRRGITRPEPRGLPRDFVDRMYDNFDRRTRRAVLNLYRDARQIGDTAGRAIPTFAEADLPALVIWGAHDSYLPPVFAERQREPFPSAEIHVLPDSGHWPFVDDPPAVTRLLADFLR